jgi:hypothetical protein
MTLVRVNEETSNLSHWIRKLLTYLMRSIRVGGCTHCWVVGSLLKEQEREHFRVASEQSFMRVRAHIPR